MRSFSTLRLHRRTVSLAMKEKRGLRFQTRDSRSEKTFARRNHVLRGALIVGTVLCMCLLSVALKSRNLEDGILKANQLSLITTRLSANPLIDSCRLAILIRLEDLECGVCLADILSISKFLDAHTDKFGKSVVYLFEQDSRDKESFGKVVNQWKRRHSIRYEALVADSFSRIGILHSCVVVKRENGYEVSEFPLGRQRLKAIIGTLICYSVLSPPSPHKTLVQRRIEGLWK